MNTQIQERKFLHKPESPVEIDLEKAEGSILYDTKGNTYIDLMSGWCVGNIGWGRKEILDAIKSYSGPEYVSPAFQFKPWLELAEMLAEITPGDLQCSYRTTGGSESVDAAIQIAMAYTGRKKIGSVEDSYHGNTIATLSIGATETASELKNSLSSCVKFKTPLDAKALKKIETKLRTREYAAFILEPVLCNIGVHIPEREFFDGLREICTHYGTLLVADEVPSGFGRTGKMFASDHFELEPDIMCLAKGLSGGYGALGATIVTSKVEKKVRDKVSIYSTFGWHPLATIAAIANLRFILENEEKLFDNVAARSKQLRTGLSQMKFKKGGKLSIIGLAIAIDVEDQKYAEKIRDNCFKRGLILSNQGNKIVMFPALTIGKSLCDTVLKTIEQAI